MKKFYLKMLIVLTLLFLGSATGVMAVSTEGQSDLLPMGTQAPDFSLTDVVSGNIVSLADFSSKKVLVVAFICRHCPFVQRIKTGLAQFGNDYADQDVAFVTISSNDATVYPDDAPDKLKEMALEEKFVMPLLYDENQAVAKAYTAVATPDIFVFDADRKLVYRGQFDDARPGNEVAVTGKDLRANVDAVLTGSPLPTAQKPSVGCGIKWKKD